MGTTIGVIFDFDDTLAPDSTTRLLDEYDIDTEEFWFRDFQNRVEAGYDPTVAYLSLLLEKTGADRSLGELTIDDLEAFGAELDEQLYSGLPELFDDIDAIVAEYEEVSVEYYIISEGLEPIIRGTTIADRCDAIYGSRLDTDSDGFI